MPQHLQRRPAEGAEGIEIFFVEPLRAGPRDDEDLVARGQGNEQDAGQIPEPEQGQEQGEQHDLGQRIGQKDHRGQRIVHGTDMAQNEPERESHQPCEAHGGEHPPGAGPGMLPECACGERFPEIGQHVQRTRQQKFAERQRSNLPDRQQGRQRQQVTEEGTHDFFLSVDNCCKMLRSPVMGENTFPYALIQAPGKRTPRHVFMYVPERDSLCFPALESSREGSGHFRRGPSKRPFRFRFFRLSSGICAKSGRRGEP